MDFYNTRNEIEGFDLQVEVFVKPQEVSSFDIMMVMFFFLDMSSNKVDTLQ